MCENSEVLMLKGRHWSYSSNSLGPNWGPEHFMDRLILMWIVPFEAEVRVIPSWGQDSTRGSHAVMMQGNHLPMWNNIRAASCPWAASPYPWKRARCSHHVNQWGFSLLCECVPIYTTGGWNLLCFGFVFFSKKPVLSCFFPPLVVFLDMYLDII